MHKKLKLWIHIVFPFHTFPQTQVKKARIYMRDVHIQSLLNRPPPPHVGSVMVCKCLIFLKPPWKMKVKALPQQLLSSFSVHFVLLTICAGKPGFPGKPSFPGIPWKKELMLNWFVANRELTTPTSNRVRGSRWFGLPSATKVPNSYKYDWWFWISFSCAKQVPRLKHDHSHQHL